MRFCQQWQIYADDITVRTGRVLDGIIYSDEEYAKRVSSAKEREVFKIQPLEESFRHLGFRPEGLGQDDKKVVREKTKKEKAKDGKGRAASSDPSPYAHGVHGCVQGALWHATCKYTFSTSLFKTVVAIASLSQAVFRADSWNWTQRCGCVPTPRARARVGGYGTESR